MKTIIQLYWSFLGRKNILCQILQVWVLARLSVLLGAHVSKDGVALNPHKIEAVKIWVWPNNVSELRSFIDLYSYYYWFVKGFTYNILQMTNLTKQNISFVWSNEREENFLKPKTLLTVAPVLAFHGKGKNFIVY